MKSALVFALVSLGLLGMIATVYAGPWSAIGTGYAVTSNYQGIDVPPGSTVVVTAGTTDLSVLQVRFQWNAPDGTTPFDEWVAVSSLSTPNVPPDVPQELIDWANEQPSGTQYKCAQSTHAISIVGDWGVQAQFKDTVRIRGQALTAIRATSFNVIPEVPFGTMVILVSMFGALGVFVMKKRRMTNFHISKQR